jgi:hypothetical protein
MSAMEMRRRKSVFITSLVPHNRRDRFVGAIDGDFSKLEGMLTCNIQNPTNRIVRAVDNFTLETSNQALTRRPAGANCRFLAPGAIYLCVLQRNNET